MKISRNAPCTVSGNMISGTYASFNCTVAISSSIKCVKQCSTVEA